MVAKRVTNFAISEDLLGEQRVNAEFNGVYSFSASPSKLHYSILDSSVLKT